MHSISLFALEPSLLSNILHVGSDPTADTPNGAPTAKGAPTNEALDQRALAAKGCAACGHLTFATTDDQRSHFRSDWHRYNIKRQVKGGLPVTEAAFEELNEISSIEASDSEEDEEARSEKGGGVDGRDVDVDDGDGRGWGVSNRTPFLHLYVTPGYQLPLPRGALKGIGVEEVAGRGRKALQIYKRVLFPKQEEPSSDVELIVKEMERLKNKQPDGKPATWTLLMLGAGHFAGAVFECTPSPAGEDPKPIAHKTFHRYTTRRKQGGAQSSNDSGKGKANSAGAMLRRYNEQALQQEVQDLLTEWKKYLSSSSIVFVHVPSQSRRIIFFDDSVLSYKDPRIRSFPLITRRPTLGELTRCFVELSSVRLKEIVDTSKNNASPAPQRKATAKGSPKPQPATPTKPALDDRMAKLVDLAKKGKVDVLQAYLASHKGVAEMVPTRIPDALGTSLLHVAASAGQGEMVADLLSLGADPTLREEKGKTRSPYEVSEAKDVRDAFRRAYAADADGRWDWAGAGVPSPLTAEMEERQREREREKRRKQKEKQKKDPAVVAAQLAAELAVTEAEEAAKKAEEERKAEKAKKASVFNRIAKFERESIGMTPEQRARLDREKRALAAEARIRGQQSKCSFCSSPIVTGKTFDKFQFRYCSMECLHSQEILHPTTK
ncbi:hypothetical protein HK101_004332 [Irineochytrium annulatum]|nr:hypothetical protein HK101_004332 [Irineochytrium annulatum]